MLTIQLSLLFILKRCHVCLKSWWIDSLACSLHGPNPLLVSVQNSCTWCITVWTFGVTFIPLDMNVQTSWFLLHNLLQVRNHKNHNIIQDIEGIRKYFHCVVRWTQAFKLVSLLLYCCFLQACPHNNRLFKRCIVLTSLHFVAKPSPNHHRKSSLDQSANEVLVGAKLQLQVYSCQDCWIQLCITLS